MKYSRQRLTQETYAAILKTNFDIYSISKCTAIDTFMPVIYTAMQDNNVVEFVRYSMIYNRLYGHRSQC